MLSVVLSTLGNYAVLRRVLDSYSSQDAPADGFEMLVVADAADPHPERVDEAIGERAYPVRRLTGHRPGLSANRNTGWRAAGAPVVLFTDNDTIPVRRLVAEHLEWHRRHPEPGVAVVGHVRWADEVKTTPFMRWLEQGIQFDFGSIRGDEASWAHLYGANCSIKRDLLEAVGGYDEKRLPYGYEDLELGYRAREHGLRVLYNRRAVVDHVRHDMTLDFWRRRIRRSAAAERRFVSLHPELTPHLHTRFTRALAHPPARGRGARLTRFVPPGLPLLGPRVWGPAALYWEQQLAPDFLDAWEKADVEGESAPELAERSDLG